MQNSWLKFFFLIEIDINGLLNAEPEFIHDLSHIYFFDISYSQFLRNKFPSIFLPENRTIVSCESPEELNDELLFYQLLLIETMGLTIKKTFKNEIDSLPRIKPTAVVLFCKYYCEGILQTTPEPSVQTTNWICKRCMSEHSKKGFCINHIFKFSSENLMLSGFPPQCILDLSPVGTTFIKLLITCERTYTA